MRRPPVIVWVLVFGLLVPVGVALLVAFGVRTSSAQSSAAPPAPTYVGSETCKGCHEAQWTAFQSNPHHRAELDGAVIADRTGCESCHGPGSAHAEAGGDRKDPGFATIRNFKNLKPAEASAVCAGCHTNGEQFMWSQSSHARNDISCVRCHSIHHPQNPGGGPMLNAPDVNHLCVTCHKEKAIALARSGHMPLREGGMTCVSCHNPHGSPGQKMIRAATVNDLCYTCHADKRGPMLWEHAPVRENCLNCHQPHGSNNDKVLAGKRPYLCQRCHVPTQHPSTLYDYPDLVSNRLFNRSCTNCHSQIHGSNHPSGRYFLR
jgi:DmsE family decaheme c-type cytochrome